MKGVDFSLYPYFKNYEIIDTIINETFQKKHIILSHAGENWGEWTVKCGGIYFYTLQVGEFKITNKMLLLQ